MCVIPLTSPVQTKLAEQVWQPYKLNPTFVKIAPLQWELTEALPSSLFVLSSSFLLLFCSSFFSSKTERPEREGNRLRERETVGEPEMENQRRVGLPEARFPVVVAWEADGGKNPEPEPVKPSRNPTNPENPGPEPLLSLSVIILLSSLFGWNRERSGGRDSWRAETREA